MCIYIISPIIIDHCTSLSTKSETPLHLSVNKLAIIATEQQHQTKIKLLRAACILQGALIWKSIYININIFSKCASNKLFYLPGGVYASVCDLT